MQEVARELRGGRSTTSINQCPCRRGSNSFNRNLTGPPDTEFATAADISTKATPDITNLSYIIFIYRSVGMFVGVCRMARSLANV